MAPTFSGKKMNGQFYKTFFWKIIYIWA